MQRRDFLKQVGALGLGGGALKASEERLVKESEVANRRRLVYFGVEVNERLHFCKDGRFISWGRADMIGEERYRSKLMLEKHFLEDDHPIKLARMDVCSAFAERWGIKRPRQTLSLYQSPLRISGPPGSELEVEVEFLSHSLSQDATTNQFSPQYVCGPLVVGYRISVRYEDHRGCEFVPARISKIIRKVSPIRVKALDVPAPVLALRTVEW